MKLEEGTTFRLFPLKVEAERIKQVPSFGASDRAPTLVMMPMG